MLITKASALIPEPAEISALDARRHRGHLTCCAVIQVSQYLSACPLAPLGVGRLERSR